MTCCKSFIRRPLALIGVLALIMVGWEPGQSQGPLVQQRHRLLAHEELNTLSRSSFERVVLTSLIKGTPTRKCIKLCVGWEIGQRQGLVLEGPQVLPHNLVS
jgi:hypothetical protein